MTIKKLAALATAAALALCMLAGCFGGSRAMTSGRCVCWRAALAAAGR